MTTWELVKQESVCLLRFESWELCWRRESEFGLEGEVQVSHEQA